MAKPQPKGNKRKRWQGGRDGRESRLWRPAKHKPGLAAVKHAQRQGAERGALARQQQEQQGRAFAALAHVVADAGGGGWPESMTRELQGCATPQERQAWAVKWGAVLSGQAERDRRVSAKMCPEEMAERPQGFSWQTYGRSRLPWNP